MLAVTTTPAAQGETQVPLMIVHGLFGSGRNWGGIARRLATGRRVIAPDLRNHGDSPWQPGHSYPDMAADLAGLAQEQGAPLDILGHSMGGKAAMWLALTQPGLVRRLVVADIAPVAYAHDQLGNIRAMQGLDLTGLPTRAEADRRLSASLSDPALRAFFLQSLDLRGADGPRWRLNLAVLADQMPHILGWPATEARFDGPTLFLTGADSRYVRAEHREGILQRFPHARFARLPGAGHWLHADKPQEFVETVRVFLEA